MSVIRLLYFRAVTLLGLGFACFSVWQMASLVTKYVISHLPEWLLFMGLGV